MDKDTNRDQSWEQWVLGRIWSLLFLCEVLREVGNDDKILLGKVISCYLLNNAFLDLVSFIHIRSFDASSGTRFEPVFTPLSSSMLKNFFKTLTCRVFNNLFNSWKIPNGTQEQFLLLLLSSHSLTISREISKTEQRNLDKLVEKSYPFVFETLRDFAFL